MEEQRRDKVYEVSMMVDESITIPIIVIVLGIVPESVAQLVNSSITINRQYFDIMGGVVSLHLVNDFK